MQLAGDVVVNKRSCIGERVVAWRQYAGSLGVNFGCRPGKLRGIAGQIIGELPVNIGQMAGD